MSTTLSIPDCAASQILGDQVIPLASGTLHVLYSPGSSDDNNITLTIGPSIAFEVQPAKFFTHVDDSCLYFFSVFVGADKVGSGHYVRLSLPETIYVKGSEEERLRDMFEEALIEKGYLSSKGEGQSEEAGPSTGEGKLISTANAYAKHATKLVAHAGITVGERVVGLFGSDEPSRKGGAAPEGSSLTTTEEVLHHPSSLSKHTEKVNDSIVQKPIEDDLAEETMQYGLIEE